MSDPRYIEPILVDEWLSCYKAGWKGLICDEAFAHPAKYSRALIRFIYQHVIDCGWIHPGDHVVDPFGGVALGGLDAMRHGLNWTGCELEAKFHALGNQNIALWNDRYSRMPNWGTARLLNGDSRKLASVIAEADCCVSSPPYAGNAKSDYLMSEDGKSRQRDEKRGFRQGNGCFRGSEGAYGQSEGQLGAMKEGDLQCAISSPPYVGSLANAKNYADPEKAQADSEREFMQHRSSTYADLRYGETEGNLGAMPEGQLCVSSPPYVAISPEKSSKSVDYAKQYETYRSQGGGASFEKFVATQELHSQGYGESDGQLSAMRSGSFDAAVSSPPFESSTQVNNTPGDMTEGRARWEGGTDSAARVKQDYADYSLENLGNQRGETFWSASRTILEQLHQVLAPNAHAVFVVKRFVRNKQVVDFPAQWAQLCEAAGFRLIHDHHALLTEEYGEQHRLDGGTDLKTVARKSFFRRLAESKGSPKIDYENALCFERLP